jgi:hypothetical protein
MQSSPLANLFAFFIVPSLRPFTLFPFAEGFRPPGPANVDASGARHAATATKIAAAYRATSVAAATNVKCARVPAGTRHVASFSKTFS